MKTLQLFNAVVSRPSTNKPFVSEEGYVIEANAIWAKDQIIDFYKKETLSGNDLNKTFHKSWVIIKESPRWKLMLEQITHYVSTYGSNFQDEVYIPDEVLDVPDVKLSFKVIKAYSVEEMTDKCLSLLKSGIALKEETLDDILTFLSDELSYKFTGKEGIRNKEAIIKIADQDGVLPADIMDFFRYIIYRATGDSLLIKSTDVTTLIKNSSFNPGAQFNKFGLVKLAEIFNRFKPLFLAFKGKCPKTINKISKLSKKHHKPMVQNPLNHVTYSFLNNEDMHWLDNATPFALFKAISACHTRANGQNSFVYRIRNGKSWTKKGQFSNVAEPNLYIILHYLKNRYDLRGKKIFLPKDVEYALPTSEKMFVGNIPTGTRFSGKKLAVGVYWEDSWGANDLDLSGLNVGGKIGWNADYKQGNFLYSGDITSAPNGAVEYLYAKDGLSEPTLVQNNVFSGRDDCEYKIIVGKGDKITRQYMMNPNKLFAEVKCQSVQTNTILGIFIPKGEKQSFVLLNFGAGHARVSGESHIATLSTKALYQQWNNAYTFNELVQFLGAEVVENVEDANIDLSLDKLEKDTFTKMFV